MRYQAPSIHYLPAQPGWTLATPIGCDHDEETAGIYGLHIEPIICWQMVTEVSEARDRHPDGEHNIVSWANPVTAHRAYSYDDEYAIGKPDGTFSEPESQDFESADAVLTAWRESARRKARMDGAEVPE